VTDNQPIELLRLLAARLERLPVDSRWARRASGLRGNIIKILVQADMGEPVAAVRLHLLTDTAFEFLRRAAQELPNPEALVKTKGL